MKKIVVIGTCGSGKTTMGRALAQKLSIPCLDMDELFWLPGWKKRPFDAFESLVKQATNRENWIISGNYSKLQHLTLAQADTVVWLDLPLHVLLWRILKRSVLQHFTKATICNGNRQSFSQFWWLFKHLFTSYWSKKKRYQKLKETSEVTWIHLKSTRQANAWLQKRLTISNP